MKYKISNRFRYKNNDVLILKYDPQMKVDILISNLKLLQIKNLTENLIEKL
jgi:hypothetical protein